MNEIYIKPASISLYYKFKFYCGICFHVYNYGVAFMVTVGLVLYVAMGFIVSVIHALNFIRLYQNITITEILFCCLMLPFWPVLAYNTFLNFIETKKD